MSAAAVLKRDEQNRSAELVLSGEWLLDASVDNRTEIINAFVSPEFTSVVLNGGDIADWDSQLAAFLVDILSLCKKNKVTYTFSNFPEGVESLLDLAFSVPEHVRTRQMVQRESFLIFLGNMALRIWESLKTAYLFTRQTYASLVRFLMKRFL